LLFVFCLVIYAHTHTKCCSHFSSKLAQLIQLSSGVLSFSSSHLCISWSSWGSRSYTCWYHYTKSSLDSVRLHVGILYSAIVDYFYHIYNTFNVLQLSMLEI